VGYYPLEPTPPNTRTDRTRAEDENGDYSVNSSYYYRADRNRNVTSAAVTRYADNFAGKSHEFKFGFEFERSKIVNEYGYPGGRLYYDYGGAPYESISGTVTSSRPQASVAASTRRTTGRSTIG
jgi:hypothetical protein